MIDQAAIVDEVNERIAELLDVDIPVEAMCLQHAVLTVEAIRARGHRAILQAGSAGWRFKAPELDDGNAPTHFSYVWDMTCPGNQRALADGLLPEMHVWAALAEPPTIIDLTSKYWPAQARRLAGLEWTAELPPPFVWGVPPAGARYMPVPAATFLALEFAAVLFGVPRVRALVR